VHWSTKLSRKNSSGLWLCDWRPLAWTSSWA
jgi:hypothetical protein